ncbi:MAG TPA: transposase [Candidatus Bipolaricaulota bacterium]|nr:transposase [Candidatus Bipolaricaulota bacterium]
MFDNQLYKNKYRIDSIRLKGWDYCDEAYYFITICVKNANTFLGNIDNDKMILSEIGLTAKNFWLKIPKCFPTARLDIFQIMPNHMHGIILINNDDDLTVKTAPRSVVETRRGASLQRPSNHHHYVRKFGPLQKKSISSIINHFKGAVKKWCNNNNFEYFEWQKKFHDHIIRDENAMARIQRYITNNPMKWHRDRNNK